MRLEYQVIAACMLDVIMGDPRWFPHPVKGIGRLALYLEKQTRANIANEKNAGIIAAVVVIFVSVLATYTLILVASQLHPLMGDIISILVIYTCIAAKDLDKHGKEVYSALERGDIEESRKKVAMLVGRDTEKLDEAEISRAAIESISENTVDGITSPLFYAVLGGPIGAIAYKAINTLDSTFGYKNEKYINFGWASARIDDAANYIPARITALVVSISAVFLKMRPAQSLKIMFRDHSRHPSPNAGYMEAAVAGALGVRLGGLNYYFGEPSHRPEMGDPVEEISKSHITGARGIMWTTYACTLILLIIARMLITS